MVLSKIKKEIEVLKICYRVIYLERGLDQNKKNFCPCYGNLILLTIIITSLGGLEKNLLTNAATLKLTSIPINPIPSGEMEPTQ